MSQGVVLFGIPSVQWDSWWTVRIAVVWRIEYDFGTSDSVDHVRQKDMMRLRSDESEYLIVDELAKE